MLRCGGQKNCQLNWILMGKHCLRTAAGGGGEGGGVGGGVGGRGGGGRGGAGGGKNTT